MDNIIQKLKKTILSLTFFDYFVLFSVVLVVSFFTYKRLQQDTTWVNVTLSVENSDWWYRGSPPYYWYAADLQKGAAARDSFGRIIAQVVDVHNFDSGGPQRKIHIDLKLKVNFDETKNQYLYEFRPLTVGRALNLDFPRNQVRGSVINLGSDKREYYYQTISVEVKEVLPELANQVAVGDKSTDNNGNLLVEVLEKNVSQSAEYEYSDIRGKKIKVFDPDYRDLDLRLKIRVFDELDRTFYINDAAIKLGYKIWFQFEDYALEKAVVTSIE